MAHGLVCGTGVGGLAAGLALRKIGIEVSLFERHEELRTFGAGIMLWPNGVRALRELGVEAELEETGAALEYWITLREDGEILDDYDLSPVTERFGAPMMGIHRFELNSLLARALGETRLKFGRELTAFGDQGDRVTCEFDAGGPEAGDFLIGADGIHSAVRTQLFGDIELRQTGLVRFRGIFGLDDVGVDPGALVNVFSDRGHFGWLPIGAGRGYFYSTAEGVNEWADFHSYFGSWRKTLVPRVIEGTAEDTFIRNRLLEATGLPDQWGRGRVTLLGDAAHPMLPGAAQGACQALEDAVSLGRSMSEAGTPEAGLRAYEQARIAVAKRVVEASKVAFDSHRTPRDRSRQMEEYYQVVESPA